jgi:RNA polymerase sigma-70 factor (ECF subfamily)
LEDDPTDQAEDKNHLLPVAGYEGKTHDKLETIDLIQKALAGLGDDQRTAIILKEYMGLSLEEVAEVMECPLSTAKSRLYNGIREVQGNLTRMGFRIED